MWKYSPFSPGVQIHQQSLSLAIRLIQHHAGLFSYFPPIMEADTEKKKKKYAAINGNESEENIVIS